MRQTHMWQIRGGESWGLPFLNPRTWYNKTLRSAEFPSLNLGMQSQGKKIINKKRVEGKSWRCVSTIYPRFLGRGIITVGCGGG